MLILIGYGKDTEQKLDTYIDDLSEVLDAFVCQTGIFCSRRLGSEIETKRSFSLSVRNMG